MRWMGSCIRRNSESIPCQSSITRRNYKHRIHGLLRDPDIDILIRRATRNDIPGIVDVWSTSVTDEEVAGFGAPSAESPFGSVVSLSAAWKEPNLIRSEEVIVAEIHGRIAGCLTIEERAESLELVNIDVLRELQGKGIGTQMVQYVEDLAKERHKPAVTLGTSRRADGVPWKSLPWWQSHGYTITHEEENAWTKSIGPSVKEIRMRKDLPQN